MSQKVNKYTKNQDLKEDLEIVPMDKLSESQRVHSQHPWVGEVLRGANVTGTPAIVMEYATTRVGVKPRTRVARSVGSVLHDKLSGKRRIPAGSPIVAVMKESQVTVHAPIKQGLVGEELPVEHEVQTPALLDAPIDEIAKLAVAITTQELLTSKDKA